MHLRKQIEGRLEASLGLPFVRAGFTAKVFLSQGNDLSAFYWPEIILRADYVNLSGAIGILFSDQICPTGDRLAFSPVSGAVHVANIQRLGDFRYVPKDPEAPEYDKFAQALRDCLAQLPATYAEAWQLYVRRRQAGWLGKVFYEYNDDHAEFVAALKQRL